MALTGFVNLSAGDIKIKPTPPEDIRFLIGSRGYAAKLLYEHTGPDTDPLGPDNMLIFSTGLFTGTIWPTASRLTVTAKSPATGAYGYGNTGGFIGAELRKAGFDAVAVTGKSDHPVYLFAKDGEITIEDASEYWGKDALLTDGELKKKHPDSRVACIGQGGENLVRVAAVMNDGGRAAGRTGMGAVMGSKNLKAVVAFGSRKVSMTDEYRKIAVEKAKKVSAHPASIDYRTWGTSILMNYKNPRGDIPTRNHQECQAPVIRNVNAQALHKYVYKNAGCFACPIRCGRLSRVESGKFSCEAEGPEYETVNSFGPMVGNENMESIIYANHLCNMYGIDTISTGVIIAFAMECRQRGYLKDEELSLEWGDTDSIIGLIKKIAFRKGIGNILADGVKRASAAIHPDTEKFALHVKGLETPQQEPRTSRGLALGHAVSNRGADHLYGLSTIDQTHNKDAADRYFPGKDENDLFNVYTQRYKPELVKFSEAMSAVTDSLGICKFSTIEAYQLGPEDLVEGMKIYGDGFEDLTVEELLSIGERIVCLERMYNRRHGFDRKDDQLPERFIKEPMTVWKEGDGELTKEVLVKDLLVDLDGMLDEYYSLRGWSEKGIPLPETLRRLGLSKLEKDL